MAIQTPKPIPLAVAEHEHRLREAGLVCVRCDHTLGLDVQVLVGEGLAHYDCEPFVRHAALIAEAAAGSATPTGDNDG